MILTDDALLAEKAKYLTKQAKDDKIRYFHNEIGYNFRLTNIQAALGVAQLEQLSAFMERKRDIFSQYKTAVENIAGLTMTGVPDYADNNHWMNMLQIDSVIYGEDPESLFQWLEENDIIPDTFIYLTDMEAPFHDEPDYPTIWVSCSKGIEAPFGETIEITVV